MQNRLVELRRKRAEGEAGFTLIELLVVVVIIGILIAIAIPVYLNYQKGAKDKSAASDLRSAIGVLEQCNSDNNGYPGVVAPGASALTAASTAPSGVACPNQTVNVSAGTTLTYFLAASTTVPAYIIESKNSGGSGKIYCYSSAVGGAIVTSTVATVITAYPSTTPPACV